MKLKKKDLDALKFNYLEESIANLQIQNCDKDIKLLEKDIEISKLQSEKKRLEISAKQNVGKTLVEKLQNFKKDRKALIENIEKDYKLEKFTGYDPETGEIK